MKLNQLRVLVTISDRGSFHEAARQLHITQPALSKAIRELECSVGATLLERRSTGTRLTPYGRRLAEHARLILGSVQQARVDIDNMKGRVGGEVAVGTTPVAASMPPMAAVFDDFRRAYSDVRLRVVEMRSAQLVEQLRQGMIDLAVATQWCTPERAFHVVDLCGVSSVIAARRSHPLRGARSLRELLEADWVTLDPISDNASSFSRLFSDNGFGLPLRVTECSAIPLALELCWRSDLLVVLSSQSRLSPYVTDRMTFLEIAEPLPEQRICLVRHSRHVLTGPAERLYDAIRTGFEHDTSHALNPQPN